MKSTRFLLVGFAAVVLCTYAAASAGATGLQTRQSMFTPHRVLYKMELGHAHKDSNVSGASGTMYYRFEPLCDGWESESRVFMNLLYGAPGQEEAVETTWTFKSFESYDGETFTYEVDHNHNGILQDLYAGQAGKTADGGEATFDDDDTTSVDLPAGTVFPAEYLLQLLTLAHKGQGAFSRTVFDGASKSNPYEVNTYIVGPVVDGKLALDKELPGPDQTSGKFRKSAYDGKAKTEGQTAGLPVWRIRMAYFPLQSNNEMPEFELEVDYRQDGVAEHIVQDFGDFSLNLKPTRFEALPPTVCK